MRILISKIENLSGEKSIQEVSREFLDAIKKDFSSIHQGVDYELLETLFKLDLRLNAKSNAFWKSISKDEIISSLPQYLQEYICDVLKNKLITKFERYRKILKEYKHAEPFEYLIARCLIEEGVDEENKAKIEEGEKNIESLMCQIEDDMVNYYNNDNYNQLVRARCNALLYLSQLLSPDEAMDCVQKIYKLKRPDTIIDPLFVYQTSLVSLDNAKKELKENVKEAKKEFRVTVENYHKTNMEILTLFVAIITFVLGVGGGVVYKTESLQDKLMLLGMLSLNVVVVFAVMISIVRSKWLTVNLLLIISIVCGCFLYE